MFKDVVIPVQAWLLSQSRCFRCGLPLQKAQTKYWKKGIKKISCQCGQVFIYSKKTNKYYRGD